MYKLELTDRLENALEYNYYLQGEHQGYLRAGFTNGEFNGNVRYMLEGYDLNDANVFSWHMVDRASKLFKVTKERAIEDYNMRNGLRH